MALTEAQKRAQKKYNEKNKDQRNHIRRRGAAKDLICKDEKVTRDDLLELKRLIDERLINLK